VQTGVTTLTWRPIAGSDVAAWASLLAAAEAVDQTGEHYDADDLAEELADPALDPAVDTVAVFAGDRMVAYGAVRGWATPDGQVQRVHAEGCVHPEFRRQGIGRDVLARTAARAAERRQPGRPAELIVYVHDGNAGQRALVEAAGMRPVRWWYEMDRDLAGPVDAVPVPSGLRLAAYDPASDEQLRHAHNEAFAGHWGSVPRDEPSWRQWFTGSRGFRPAESCTLWSDGEIAGYVLVYEFEADTAATGIREAWIGQVGTRPPWRGRGIASALLSHVLRTCREHGYDRVSLSVDSANATGALGLYQRVGFVITQSATSFSCPLPD
jgi:mycothiol synthase